MLVVKGKENAELRVKALRNRTEFGRSSRRLALLCREIRPEGRNGSSRGHQPPPDEAGNQRITGATGSHVGRQPSAAKLSQNLSSRRPGRPRPGGRAKLVWFLFAELKSHAAELRSAGRTRASAPTRSVLVAAFGFPQNDGEAAASEAESLRDRASHSHLGAVAGHAVSLADTPTSGPCRRPPGRRRNRAAPNELDHSSADGNFPAGVPSRIAIDSFDAGACRTSRQDQRSYDEQ